MKILYFSCHEILAYDDLNMLYELGHEVFSPDNKVEELNKGDGNLRPSPNINCSNYADLMMEWHTFGIPGKDNKENVSVDFFKKFDLIWVTHINRWITLNWERMKKSGVPVLLRTIGQNVINNEVELTPYRKQGMKIVRYSPLERKIPKYMGEDACIRFYKDPEEYNNWNGQIKEVISFGQNMQQRNKACNFKHFEDVTTPFPRKLFGEGSQTLDWGMGKVSFVDLKKAMRDYAVYFYTGTYPAPIVLNGIEAFLTGIPMVCIGPIKGHPHAWFPGHDLYEIPDIIQNGVNGFFSDSVDELRSYITSLMTDEKLAKEISKNGRDTAIRLFGKETIFKQWDEFLRTI